MEMNYQNSLMEFKINVRFLCSWKSPVTKKHIPTSTIRTNLKLDISKYSGINNLLKVNCQASLWAIIV